jgi:hypothetical protein
METSTTSTLSTILLSGMVGACVGWVAGILVQWHNDNKELEQHIFRARKKGFAEGYQRAMGKDHTEIKG